VLEEAAFQLSGMAAKQLEKSISRGRFLRRHDERQRLVAEE
jgi:hypothetical protein